MVCGVLFSFVIVLLGVSLINLIPETNTSQHNSMYNKQILNQDSQTHHLPNTIFRIPALYNNEMTPQQLT